MAYYAYEGQDLVDIDNATKGSMDTTMETYEKLKALTSDTGILGDAGKIMQENMAKVIDVMEQTKQQLIDANDGVEQKKSFERDTASGVVEALNQIK